MPTAPLIQTRSPSVFNWVSFFLWLVKIILSEILSFCFGIANIFSQSVLCWKKKILTLMWAKVYVRLCSAFWRGIFLLLQFFFYVNTFSGCTILNNIDLPTKLCVLVGHFDYFCFISADRPLYSLTILAPDYYCSLYYGSHLYFWRHNFPLESKWLQHVHES